MIDWSLTHGCPADMVEFGTEAALHGLIRTLDWLHADPRIDLDKSAQSLYLQAAASGKAEVVRWLLDHDIELNKNDSEPCVAAADHGFLEVLQLLHELGCPWSVGVCTAAAQRGDLPLLRWAHEHGCPWSAETTKAAGDPGPYNDASSYDENSRTSALEILQYLHAHGCPWHPDTLLYAGADVISWARGTGLPARMTREERLFEEGAFEAAQLVHGAAGPLAAGPLVNMAAHGGGPPMMSYPVMLPSGLGAMPPGFPPPPAHHAAAHHVPPITAGPPMHHPHQAHSMIGPAGPHGAAILGPPHPLTSHIWFGHGQMPGGLMGGAPPW